MLWVILSVGNDEVGKLLAKKLNYKYFDHNYIIIDKYGNINKFNANYPFSYNIFLERYN